MNNRERASLDRHITGNYGEDQFKHEPHLTDNFFIKPTHLLDGSIMYDVYFFDSEIEDDMPIYHAVDKVDANRACDAMNEAIHPK